MSGTALTDAVDALDRALAARPRLDGAALTEATKALCGYRDTLRVRVRAGEGGREGLQAVNGLISLVHAAHYPLAGTPWDLLEEAQRGVQSLSSASNAG